MKKTIVRYKVWPEKVGENEAFVREVYRALHELKPSGIRYSTFKLQDGVTFQHIALFETEEAHRVFTGLPAFKNFQAGVKERCEELPVVTVVEEVGAYVS